MRKKLIKIGIFSMCIVIINIFVLSRGILNFSVHSDNVVIATCSIAIPVISLIFLCLYVYSILNSKISEEKKVNYDIYNLKTEDDYMRALESVLKTHYGLENELNTLVNQVNRIQKKHNALLNFLEQNNNTSNTFLIQESENAKLFLLHNIQTVLSKFIILEVLDHDVEENQKNIFQEQMIEINKIIDNNEKTLDEYDIFLKEVSKMGEKPMKENTNLQCTITALQQLRDANNNVLNPKGE